MAGGGKRVTAQDPVCGATVNKDNLTPTCTHRGREFFFCCEDCRQAFEKDPTRYLTALSDGGDDMEPAPGC